MIFIRRFGRWGYMDGDVPPVLNILSKNRLVFNLLSLILILTSILLAAHILGGGFLPLPEEREMLFVALAAAALPTGVMLQLGLKGAPILDKPVKEKKESVESEDGSEDSEEESEESNVVEESSTSEETEEVPTSSAPSGKGKF